jgi:hypothetical protein
MSLFEGQVAAALCTAPPPAQDLSKLTAPRTSSDSFSIAAVVVRASEPADPNGHYPKPPDAPAYDDIWRRWESSARNLPWNGSAGRGLTEAHVDDCVDLLCAGLHSLAVAATSEANSAQAHRLNAPQIALQVLGADAEGVAQLTVATAHGMKERGVVDRDVFRRIRSTAIGTFKVLVEEGRIKEAMVLRESVLEAYGILHKSPENRRSEHAPVADLYRAGARKLSWQSGSQFEAEQQMVLAALRRGRPFVSIELAVGRFGLDLALRGDRVSVLEALDSGMKRLGDGKMAGTDATTLEYKRARAEVAARKAIQS